MAIALVGTPVKGSGVNGFTTGNLDTTGANLLVFGADAFDYDIYEANFTDSQSLTWTPLTLVYQDRSGQHWSCRLFYVLNPASTSATHSITVTLSARYPAGVFAAFSGVSAFASEAQVAGAANDTTRNAGSLTEASSGALFVAGAGFNVDGTIAVNSSYTIAATEARGSALGFSLAYLIGTGTKNPQFSGSTDFLPGVHAVFTATGGGGGASSKQGNQGIGRGMRRGMSRHTIRG